MAKFTLQTLGKISGRAETVKVCGGRVGFYIRPWNVTQFSALKDVIKRIAAQLKLRPKNQEIDAGVFVDLLIQNMDDIWHVIHITVDREGQNILIYDEQGKETERLHGIDKEVLMKMLEVVDLVGLARVVYDLNMKPLLDTMTPAEEPAEGEQKPGEEPKKKTES